MTLEFSRTEQAGSCNSCLGRDRKVACIGLHTINFRLCRSCADELIEMMSLKMGDFDSEPDNGTKYMQTIRWSRGIRSSDFTPIK